MRGRVVPAPAAESASSGNKVTARASQHCEGETSPLSDEAALAMKLPAPLTPAESLLLRRMDQTMLPPLVLDAPRQRTTRELVGHGVAEGPAGQIRRRLGINVWETHFWTKRLRLRLFEPRYPGCRS